MFTGSWTHSRGMRPGLKSEDSGAISPDSAAVGERRVGAVSLQVVVATAEPECRRHGLSRHRHETVGPMSHTGASQHEGCGMSELGDLAKAPTIGLQADAPT